MLSEPEAPRRGLLPLLRSQGLGLICGGATILLLAAGSVVIAYTRDGASAAVQGDDIRIFFEQPSIWHLWFYLLLAVLLVYALNTALCTWHGVARLIRGQVRAPAAYGPAVMHLGFLLALLAHAVGGVYGGEDQPVAVGPTWTALDQHRQARLLELKEERSAAGALRQVYARLELRGPGGGTHQQVVGFNQPATAELGSRLWLLARHSRALGAQLSDGEQRCVVLKRNICQLGPVRYFLMGLDPGTAGRGAAAAVMTVVPGQAHQRLMLRQGQPLQVGAATVTLTSVKRSGVVLLRVRRAPGNPWALVGVVVFALGMALMGRRWFA